MIKKCASIEEVRACIDHLDRQIVTLLADRGAYVKQAAAFKTSTDEVKAPRRVEQVITKVTALAVEVGASTAVIEAVYRCMIEAFTKAELVEFAHKKAATD